MQKALSVKPGFVSAITLVIAIIFVLVCLSILTLRISSLSKDSAITQSTGCEYTPLYGIYKVWSGRALYEYSSETASPMVFNFLFTKQVYFHLEKISSLGSGDLH